jgi:hypothetical protein
MHAYEAHAYEMHADKVQAYETHAGEMHAHEIVPAYEIYAGEVHAHEICCEKAAFRLLPAVAYWGFLGPSRPIVMSVSVWLPASSSLSACYRLGQALCT